MAQSSRYFKIDQDILLEFIYHDQGNPEPYRIEVDDNGSEVMFLDTVQGDPFSTRHLINELGSGLSINALIERLCLTASDVFIKVSLALEISIISISK